MTINRRNLVKFAGLGALTFLAGGRTVLLTPRRARAESVPFMLLSDTEAAILSAFGEALAPGAAEAGIAHYVDAQLASMTNGEADEALLIIRYLDVPPAAWQAFYQGGLAALEAVARDQFGKGVAALESDEAETLVRLIAAVQPQEWPTDAPPSPFFYFVVRADAADVVYGTMEGFDALGVPYMAHIEPETRW